MRRNTSQTTDAAPIALQPLQELLDAVESSLDDAAAVNLRGLDRKEVAQFACRVQQIRARVEAVAAVVTAEADNAAIQVLDTVRGVPTYVAKHTNAAPRAVGRDRVVGAWLQIFPLFRDAALAGILTEAHIRVLRSVCNRRTEHDLQRTQQILIDAARDCSFKGFCEAVTYWQNMYDPDGDKPTEDHKNRSVTARKNPDGTVEGSFLLDPVAGQAFLSALAQDTERLAAVDRDGNPSDPDRTHNQRQADALVGLVSRGAVRDDGTLPAPLVHVVVGAKVAEDALKRYGTEELEPGETLPDVLPLDPNDPAGRCEFVDGTPLHPSWLLSILGEAALRRIAFAPDGTVADLSTSVRQKPSAAPLTARQLRTLLAQAASVPLHSNGRSFPPHLKQALLAAARGRCQNGCHCPVLWLHADHIHPHNQGGPTSLANGQILCSHCNRRKRDQLFPAAPKQRAPVPKIITPQLE